MNNNCKNCNSSSQNIIYDSIKDWEYGIDGKYSYQQCVKCGCIQLSPFPSIMDLEEAYKIDYHGYTKANDRGIIFVMLQKFLISFLKRRLINKLHHNSHVLDIGCGNGYLLETIRNCGINNIFGIDFSSQACSLLKQKKISFFKGTFMQFKSDQYYDLIIMDNYLEHTIDPIYELKKVYSLLKNKGTLYGEVPGFDSWERKLFKKYWGGNHVPRHTFQFTQEYLKKMFIEAGFKKIKILHQINTAHIVLSIQNILNRNGKLKVKLKHGRFKWFNFLLIFFIPFNIIPVFFKKSGVIKFIIKK